MLKKKMSKMLAGLAAVVMAGSAVTATAPAADAAPRNVVLFGDSMWSNGTGTFPSQMAEFWQGPGKVTGNAPAEGRCKRGQVRVAASLQRQTGVKVEDYACNGAVAYAPSNGSNNLKRQVDQAIAQGNLNRSTRAVFMNIGILDNIKAPGHINIQTRNFVAGVRPQVERIKRAAPNAKVAFVGYPHIVDKYGTGCWIQTRTLQQVPLTIPPVRMAQDAAQHWQREAAKATGVGWIDMEGPTRANGTCAPANQRYVSGLVDNTSTPYNMTTHLTQVGNEGVARILSRHI